MAVTIKHINDDASFLLSFDPLPKYSTTGIEAEPFRILLDPWITGPSTILHSKMSITHQKHQPCISSLTELPEPDLVIISQPLPDHCNESSLLQLPATGTKTVILADPASARLIRSWKHFDSEKVRVLPKWDDSNAASENAVVRIPVKRVIKEGEDGEVTIALIQQRKDISGLHSAVCITYRPPSVTSGDEALASHSSMVWTPPSSPGPRQSYSNLRRHFRSAKEDTSTEHLSPASPTSPGLFSLRSVRSSSSIPFSVSSNLTTDTAATSVTSRSNFPPNLSNAMSSAPSAARPALSVLFSPHGITYPSLHSYATTHLAAESALPLTALLHCFDTVDNPWWLGGNILLGAPAGTETATKLGARAWISAHDGDKEVKGFANALLKTRKHAREDVLRKLRSGRGLKQDVPGDNSGGEGGAEKVQARTAATIGDWVGTEVIVLGIGEEVVLSRDSVLGGESRKAEDNEKIWSSSNGISRVTEASIVVTPAC